MSITIYILRFLSYIINIIKYLWNPIRNYKLFRTGGIKFILNDKDFRIYKFENNIGIEIYKSYESDIKECADMRRKCITIPKFTNWKLKDMFSDYTTINFSKYKQ